MEDKQIIIDGVDVSGCSYYEENPKYRMWGTCDCMRTMVDQSGYDELAGAECKSYNCYYKQLKRAEQRIVELNKMVEAKEQECEALGQAYLETNELLQEKTKECTNLKAENEELKHQIEDVDTLCNEKESLIDKYLQTLTEIKEIVSGDYEILDPRAKQQILQKISEVENG